MKLIIAYDGKFGIGKNGIIPWNIPKEIKLFKSLTTNSKQSDNTKTSQNKSESKPLIVMGYNTWKSIQKKPLPDRINIIISKSHNEKSIYPETLWFESPELFVKNITPYKSTNAPIWIIGGKSIYNWFLNSNLISELYISEILGDYKCDVSFDSNRFKNIYKNFNPVNFPTNHGTFILKHLIYKNNSEIAYQNLLTEILKNGSQRNDRTETGTISLFGKHLEFDIQNSIPLLTTKYVNWYAVILELLWFLRGDTNSKLLEADNVNIWKGNTSREFLDKSGFNERIEGDIGPMYGFQWKNFGAEYSGCNTDYNSGNNMGINQLEEVINLLRTNPYSRRIIMTTYNVKQRHEGVLYPCHGLVVQFYCEEKNNKKWLSCHMYQRSADAFLGLPFNIASYAILTYIIAQKVNMLPDRLVISMGDVHIYNNLIDQCNTQITRQPFPFPQLQIKDIRDKDWTELKLDDFEVFGYQHHPLIKGNMSI